MRKTYNTQFKGYGLPDNPMMSISCYTGKGQGVKAGRALCKGELIERAPVIVIPADEYEHIEKTVLNNYSYPWGEDRQLGAFVMGLGSFYNHSYSPNAMYARDHDNLVIDFIAIRDIEEAE